MNNFTPGPWTIDNGPQHLRVRSSVSMNHDLSVALVPVGKDADARLISASPELLKALRDICNAYRILQGASTEDHVYKQARSAIFKAIGVK